MSSIIYDAELSDIQSLTWLPWIGKLYNELPTEHKILVIGESHYLDDSPGCRERYENKKMTRMIAKDMGVENHSYGSSFFRNIYKLLLGSIIYKETLNNLLWDNIAFYNFIQEPMENNKRRPSYIQQQVAGNNFLEILKVLKPSTCVFLGVKAEQGLNDVFKDSDYKLIQNVHWTEHRYNGCWGRYGKLEAKDGQIIKLVFVKHPSKFISIGPWRNFLIKYIPSPMKWLEGLKS